MVRVSSSVFILINVVPFVVGLAAVAASIYFRINGGSPCQNALRNPLLIIGLVLFVVSLLAFIGSCCSNAHYFLLTVYSILMVLIILALTGLLLFTLVVTNKGVARRISGLKVREYHLEDYSTWLRQNVANGNWDRIRSCLSDSHVCNNLQSQATFSEFIKQQLSPIQSGCCKPPMFCKYVYKNATYWEVPKSGPDVPDSDCKTWSNNQEELCYDCKSCKAGVLSNIRKEWRFLALLDISVLIIVLIAFNVGCSLRRRKNSSSDLKNPTADLRFA